MTDAHYGDQGDGLWVLEANEAPPPLGGRITAIPKTGDDYQMENSRFSAFTVIEAIWRADLPRR
jgi:hypothetical protein